jgi:predicted DNA-binding protein
MHAENYTEIMRTISLKLPDELLAQLAKRAKARRVTRSWIVRESLEKALHEPPRAGAVSCYDLARDLAGMLKGMPKDLARNAKHTEGFVPVKKAAGIPGSCRGQLEDQPILD